MFQDDVGDEHCILLGQRINMCWLGFTSSLFHKIISYKFSVKRDCNQAAPCKNGPAQEPEGEMV